jgi:uncharacterized phage infection (PIP) family protein YhgE
MLGTGKKLVDTIDSYLLEHVEVISKEVMGQRNTLKKATDSLETEQNKVHPSKKRLQKLREKVKTSKENLAQSTKEMHKPMTKGFNKILHDHRIYREAYHGGALIGEHVRRLLRHGEDIMEQLKSLVTNNSSDHRPYTEETKAKIIEYFDNMKVAMKILNAIFHMMNDAYTIHSDLQCEQFEKMCTFIGKFWRKVLKINVPPKIHLLESQVAAVMWRLRCIVVASVNSRSSVFIT